MKRVEGGRGPRSQRARGGSAPAALRQRLVVAAALAATLLAATSCGPGVIAELGAPRASKEICGDGRDNDLDSAVDCADPDCAGGPGCGVITAGLGMPLQPPWASCGELEGDRGHTPVDMIWAVDGSASMDDEIAKVVHNINNFATYMLGLRADLHLVMLGDKQSGGREQLCVPPPFGGPDCQDGLRYRHIQRYVGNDALRQILQLYPEYSYFLRPNAKKVLVIVSDSNADGVTPDWFDQELRALGGGTMFNTYVVHSIVGYGERSSLGHPRGCPSAAAEGTTYLALSDKTGGTKFSICASFWDQAGEGLPSGIFGELGRSVAGLVDIPCRYALPTLDGDRGINTAQIQVNAEGDGGWALVPQHADGSACSANAPGWYLDNNAVRICPSVCKALSVAQLKLLFGCTDLVR
ncbi:MAG: VWA domain-containing protein [Proteobacteria bacterium]|nr:VWA domain-containing protein [Pseudomonadota bacterium]